MHRNTRWLAGCLAALLTSGCLSGPSPVDVKAKPLQRPVPSDKKGGIISDNGAGIISDNGASLTTLKGQATLPATLVSKVKFVSNGGGNIIGNNGGNAVGADPQGNYRTLAADEQPLAHQPIRLVDAAGAPVLGPNGKPLETVTDAAGRYAFEGSVPNRNLVVELPLATGYGTVRAIVSKDAPTEGGAKQVQADLVSTLATSYILNRYVAGRPEPVATLDRLPAQVEAETRTRVASALTGGQAALPELLSDEKVVATVDQLRQQDPALDVQLEKVRKLLVEVGLENLGEGRPANEVTLAQVSNLLVSPGGALRIVCGYDRRIWQMGADGRLATLAGSGVAAERIEGVAGPQAGLFNLQSAMDDPNGRLVLLEQETTPAFAKPFRISRLEADGRLHELYRTDRRVVAAVPAPEGHVLIAFQNQGEALELVKLEPDQKLTPVATFSQLAVTSLKEITGRGIDRQGRLYLSTSSTVVRLHPGTGAADVIANGSVFVDPRGVIFLKEARRLSIQKPDGPMQVLVEGTMSDKALRGLLTSDGTAYVAIRQNEHLDAVYRVVDGQLRLVAGQESDSGNTQTGDANQILLEAPIAVAIAPTGDQYVGDAYTERILKIAPDKTVSVHVGKDQLDGAPMQLIRLASGELLVNLESDSKRRLVRLGAGGAQIPHYKPSEAFEMGCYMAGPEGQDVVALLPISGGVRVRRVVAGSEGEDLMVLGGLAIYDYGLGVRSDGAVYACGNNKLFEWTAANQQRTVAENPLFKRGEHDFSGLAFDAQGRVIISASTTHTILRCDPATGQVVVLAGPGGRFFAGSGIDDSLQRPSAPCFDGAGNLYFADSGHRQIKRITAEELASVP